MGRRSIRSLVEFGVFNGDRDILISGSAEEKQKPLPIEVREVIEG